jgi:integrase
MAKVSLRVAHQKGCANASKGALSSAPTSRTRNSCTCVPGPAYYTFRRDPSGKVKKGERFVDENGNEIGGRFTDRQTAERVAAKLQRALDESRAGVVARKSTTFPAWVNEFEKILGASVSKGDIKPRTERGYLETLHRAKDSLGHVDLRQLGASELRRFDDSLAGYAVATRARHLKHLSLALGKAVDEGYLETNPVPKFTRGLKLGRRIPKRGKGPFEDGELERLWPALDDEDAPVYRHVSEFSVETGMRIGELAALDWPNVSLQEKTVRVDWTWNPTDGLVLPKDGEARTIHLTPHAVKVLEAWVAITGARTDGPVFPDPASGGRMSIRNVQRRLVKAMADAGVPKHDPSTGKPRSFHSFRYSFSNLAQRRGYHPRLIESTLGHSNLELTYGVYGGWTPDQLAAEAARTS